MANNEQIFNAVLSGAGGAFQQRWLTNTEASSYVTFAEGAEQVALAVDALIGPTSIDIGQRCLMQAICQGVFAERFPNVNTYQSIAESIVALYTAMDALLFPEEGSSSAPIVTTSGFVQPAADADVQVDISSTMPFNAGDPVYIANGGLYTVVSIDSLTALTVKNTAVDENAITGANIPSGSSIQLAHGRSWQKTYDVAGGYTFTIPSTASPIIEGSIRAASAGGGGGGGGGSGFNATTTGGGGSGGRGGGQGGSTASQVIYPIEVSPGEVLTIAIGAGGTGGVGGNPGAAGTAGSPGGNTTVNGSISGLIVQTPNLTTANVGGGGGPAGLNGTSTNGGASPAIGSGTNGQGWGTGSFTGANPTASGAGGSATNGANGANVAAQAASGYLRFGITASINGAPGNTGGTGNGVNRGGGGAGSSGASGGIGDMLRINGIATAPTDGVGGSGGHGGAADTNAGLTAGSDGANGVNGQGGAGGGGGGGGGSAVGVAQPGAAGGRGGNGSDARLVLQGTIL